MSRKRPILLLLSGEHPSLPYSEVSAILESEGVEFRELKRCDQVMVIEGGEGAGEHLERRAAYVMEGGALILHSRPSVEEILKACGDADWSFLRGRSFGVRISRVKEHWREFSSSELEGLVGGSVKNMTDSRVDLESPQVWIRGVITDCGVFLYRRDFRTDRRAFAQRKPKTRPFFHPGVLEPKIARAFVNLSRVREGEAFLDPFCGTGGFLIEAALLGLQTHGLDLDRRMISGAARNLRHYGLHAELILGDARRLPFRRVDGIATDPPYGRGTSTKGQSVKSILSEFMGEAHGVIRDGGRMCIAAPQEVAIQEVARKAGFRLHEVHTMRVHKSLTRSIVVVERVAG
ncbi:MAG: THUMP domain-containing protein [Candidatus Methanomethylicia archaeon]|nr:THUMP domain-containing protein [Candidatus Methanomethylicia archaeon]MCQ5374852.1 THUMP domain-containing protein [Candidatus Methanomethylicia archaeon]